MSSPDVTPYKDLTLYDPTSSGVYQRALNAARVLLPEWRPREGSIELIMLQALALEITELSAIINRLPSAVTEVLLKLYGIERSTGRKATTTVKFFAVDSAQRTIPKGTQVAYIPESPTDQAGIIQAPLILTTTADAVTDGVAPFSCIVSAEATVIGDTYNGLQSGTRLTAVSVNPYIERVELASIVSGGSNSESDTEYFDRAMARLDRLTRVLVRPDDFMAYVVDNPDDLFNGVYRCYAMDNTDGTNASALGSISGLQTLANAVQPNAPGFITIAVADIDGAVYDAAVREGIQVELQKRALANLAVSVIDASVVEVDISVIVKKKATASTTTVDADVRAAIKSYLNPNTWDWSDRIRYNEAVATVAKVDGVHYVDTLTLTVADSFMTEKQDQDLRIKGTFSGRVAPLFKVRNIGIDVI